MKKIIIGRKEEQLILKEAYSSKNPEFLAVTGRRRVGKTYLIRTYFDGQIDFDFSGIFNATYRQQLKNFQVALSSQFKRKSSLPRPNSWLDAFIQLAEQLRQFRKNRRLIVFLDEMPWLDTHRSNFLTGLDWFWNSWASQNNILLVVCGSATSWMIKHLYNNRGGLHNRVTKRLHLSPLNLNESKAYLAHQDIVLSDYQVLQLYMAMGGIPYYLKEVRKGESATQAIERICFQDNGLLASEFDNLYKALFDNSDSHERVIQALGSKMKGLTRKELLAVVGLKDGGTFSNVLNELEWCNFISRTYPFGKKKKEMLYRLRDEYSIFFLKFIHHQQHVNWQALSSTPTYKSWCGFAFESVCLKHPAQIKAALGIHGVYCELSSFHFRGNETEKGVQVDLLIDRRDQVINICEAKFYDKPFTLSKAYAQEFRRKVWAFQAQVQSPKSLFPTLISTFGLVPNEHSIGLIVQEVTLVDLFKF
jgi:AAA+ ATPase superfamily predicted ATPase